MSYEYYLLGFEYYMEEQEPLPKPPKNIGKVHVTKLYKKRVYFFCRNTLKTRQKLTANKIK